MAAPAPIPSGLVRRCDQHGLYIALGCPQCLADRITRERRARSTVVLVLAILLILILIALVGGWPPLPALP